MNYQNTKRVVSDTVMIGHHEVTITVTREDISDDEQAINLLIEHGEPDARKRVRLNDVNYDGVRELAVALLTVDDMLTTETANPPLVA